MATDDDLVVRRQSKGVEVVERLDVSQCADRHVDVAGTQARRQLTPRRDDDAQPQPGMVRVQTTDRRGNEHRSTPWADADAQLAQLEALGQADLAIEVAGAGIERCGVAQQQTPTSVSSSPPGR